MSASGGETVVFAVWGLVSPVAAPSSPPPASRLALAAARSAAKSSASESEAPESASLSLLDPLESASSSGVGAARPVPFFAGLGLASLSSSSSSSSPLPPSPSTSMNASHSLVAPSRSRLIFPSRARGVASFLGGETFVADADEARLPAREAERRGGSSTSSNACSRQRFLLCPVGPTVEGAAAAGVGPGLGAARSFWGVGPRDERGEPLGERMSAGPERSRRCGCWCCGVRGGTARRAEAVNLWGDAEADSEAREEAAARRGVEGDAATEAEGVRRGDRAVLVTAPDAVPTEAREDEEASGGRAAPGRTPSSPRLLRPGAASVGDAAVTATRGVAPPTTDARDDDTESERMRLLDAEPGSSTTGAGLEGVVPSPVVPLALPDPDRPPEAPTAAPTLRDGVAGLDAGADPPARAGEGGGGMRAASAPRALESLRGLALGRRAAGERASPTLEINSCLTRTRGEPTDLGLAAAALVDARGVSDPARGSVAVAEAGAGAVRRFLEVTTTISLSASESELPRVDATEGELEMVRSSSSRPSAPFAQRYFFRVRFLRVVRVAAERLRGLLGDEQARTFLANARGPPSPSDDESGISRVTTALALPLPLPSSLSAGTGVAEALRKG